MKLARLPLSPPTAASTGRLVYWINTLELVPADRRKEVIIGAYHYEDLPAELVSYLIEYWNLEGE